jgi:hypothetical protein
MQYEWSADNWLSQDLTFFSEHITASGIVYTAWAQNPDNLFLCALANGDVAVLTYERGENIFGWSKQNFSDDILDVTTIRVQGRDVMAGLFSREDGQIYVEIVPLATDQYVDSWIRKVNVPAATIVVGLEHLEGREVQPVVDGAVHPKVTVVSGQITLDYPGEEVIVGLPYSGILKTLPLDPGASTGSLKPYEKRNISLYVEFLASGNPLINGKRQPSRTPSTPMNTPEPIKTGASVVYNLCWDRYAFVDIEQDLPLPCNLISIGAETGTEKL